MQPGPITERTYRELERDRVREARARDLARAVAESREHERRTAPRRLWQARVAARAVSSPG
jgi:hypothetical protein